VAVPSAEAVVDATDDPQPRCGMDAVADAKGSNGDRSIALFAAALALPGIVPVPALAQSAPDEGVVALRYYDYRDWQPGRTGCR
jgi:hypothetical protein